jgi:ribosome recycling factor
MIDEVFEETKEKMVKTINTLEKELSRVRTGRASLSLLDSVKVEYYGTLTPLNQMATLAVPESRMITIQPWDTTVIKEIEKAILKANLGLNPSNDGKIIRITIPPLTEDRRKEIVKQVNKICEEFKITARNIRRDSNEMLKLMKKESEITEDDHFKAQEETQKITDKFIQKINEIYKVKESEILEF